MLFLDHLDAIGDDGIGTLLDALAMSRGPTLIAGTKPWPSEGSSSLGVFTVPMSIPDEDVRRACWRDGLAMLDVALPDEDLDDLSAAFV